LQSFATQESKLNLATAAKSLVFSISEGLHIWLFTCREILQNFAEIKAEDCHPQAQECPHRMRFIEMGAENV
jgi:hypothetical protein